MDDDLLALVRKIDELNGENSELKAELAHAATVVVDLQESLTEARAAIEGPEAKGVFFGTVLAGAQNYVEMRFAHPEGGMVVTAQRIEGQSPGQFVSEANEIMENLTTAFAEGKDLHPWMLGAIAWRARIAKKVGE